MGSASKLRTYTDGPRILRTIILLMKEVRPFQFFAVGAVVLGVAALGLGIPVVAEFIRTGLVAPLADGSAGAGADGARVPVQHLRVILDSVARGRKEAKRMAYLSVPAVGAGRSP